MLSWTDKAEIMDLPARYNHAVDKRDALGWANVFTNDGSVTINGRVLASGRDELIAYIERNKLLPAKRQHWISNAVIDPIDGSPDTAQLRLYICAYDITDALAKAPYSIGEYDDLVAREGGRWLFKCRRLSLLAGESGVGEQTRAA